MELRDLNILIAGQVLTSRTETIECYYRDKVRYLGVIGISNPFAIKGLARCTLYEKGKRIKEFPVFSVQLKGIYWLNQLLMGSIFLLYALSMLWTVLKLKKKFDVFIGIACFSTLFGFFLKKLGIVKNVVYYTLDYYPLPMKFHINTLVNRIIWSLDKYCCRKSCLVWNISHRILEARENLMNFNRTKYNHILVPLTYGENLLRFKPPEAIEEDTLVFVGTISRNQGLRLVVEAIPELIRFKPKLKVRIIGKGPAEEGIRRMVNVNGLKERFIFHGFIEKEEDVLDIVSRCAIGICPWTDEPDSNIIYADPGKPKLYAFCGTPIIITKVTAVAKEIDDLGAGIAISYNREQFIGAVLKILESEETLEKYRKNAHSFAIKYTTEAVFGDINKEVIRAIESNRRV